MVISSYEKAIIHVESSFRIRTHLTDRYSSLGRRFEKNGETSQIRYLLCSFYDIFKIKTPVNQQKSVRYFVAYYESIK